MSDDAEAAGGVLPATDPRAYRFWVREIVRFDDLDLLGHVNNKAFTTYAESGRAAFLREIGLWRPQVTRQSVVVRLEIDYLRELNYPGEPQVGVRVLRIGEKSFTLGVGIFDKDQCAAVASTVFVRMDTTTRRASPLTDEERGQLQPHLAV